MNFKQIVRDYFTFTRSERRGVIVLLILIFLFALANKFIFYFEKPGKIDSMLIDSLKSELGTFNDSVRQMAIVKKSSDKAVYSELENKSPEAELFQFNPNTATDQEFRRLGLSEKLIGTIRNYQDKGGIFRSKNDFFRIYGLTESQKRRLGEFVIIESSDNLEISSKNKGEELRIELNSADSISLENLPGIGDKLSKRIVKYRDLLGGFHSVDQLQEVYGITNETFSMIENRVTVDGSKIKKLDLNFSDLNELSRHPYVKKVLAQKIIKFRSKYGSFRDLSILRDSMILNIDEYARLKPYF